MLETDAAGTPTYRNAYAPFGKRTQIQVGGSLPGSAKGYIDQRNDPSTGLIYLNARYLDPDLGIFTQPGWLDPLAPGVGPNRFAYAGNDPINQKDPNGNFFDVFFDAAFIAYDVASIGWDYATTGKVDPVDVAALSADVAAVFVPG